jgi:hypothetical protein
VIQVFSDFSHNGLYFCEERMNCSYRDCIESGKFFGDQTVSYMAISLFFYYEDFWYMEDFSVIYGVGLTGWTKTILLVVLVVIYSFLSL